MVLGPSAHKGRRVLGLGIDVNRPQRVPLVQQCLRRIDSHPTTPLPRHRRKPVVQARFWKLYTILPFLMLQSTCRRSYCGFEHTALKISLICGVLHRFSATHFPVVMQSVQIPSLRALLSAPALTNRVLRSV